jgi:phosphoglycerol transferase MdoB-like AlkP superfamily enzyme
VPSALAVCLAVSVGVCSYPDQLLAAFDMSLFDCSKQIDNYTCNGFTGGFALNLMSLRVEKPQGYSQETVEALLDDRDEVASNEDYADYDVILVLSESFFDLRELEGVTYSEDLLTNYDAMRASENCYSGTLYTTAIGGGTVRPEFHILTGLTTDVLPTGAVPYTYVNHEVESYVSNYKDAGYNTVALHLYDESFYSRNKGYPYIGFDQFLGLSDVQAELEVSFTRNYATDASTEQAIEYYLEQAGENGNPTFLFAVTIENHQPYGENENNTVTVTADGLDDTALQALTTYAQGVKDADEMLGALKEYIDNRERPTILVWYGDHKPTLGEVHTPYEALGFYDSQDQSTENRMAMYSTPFLVYSNRTLDQGLFTSKSDNQISDSYLLECVAVSSGFQQTPYMTLLGEMVEELPVYNMRLNMDDSLTESQSALVQAQKIITYDRLIGKRYSQH